MERSVKIDRLTRIVIEHAVDRDFDEAFTYIMKSRIALLADLLFLIRKDPLISVETIMNCLRFPENENDFQRSLSTNFVELLEKRDFTEESELDKLIRELLFCVSRDKTLISSKIIEILYRKAGIPLMNITHSGIPKGKDILSFYDDLISLYVSIVQRISTEHPKKSTSWIN